jgi:hypothetical protein
VLGATRALNRVELAGETLRAALEALAVAAPGWLASVIGPFWQQVYGARIDDLYLPGSQAARRDLMVRYGADGGAPPSGFHVLHIEGPHRAATDKTGPDWARRSCLSSA